MDSHLITIGGTPRGGAVTVRVFSATRVQDFTVETAPGDSARRIAHAFYERMGDRPVFVPLYRVSHAGALVLVVGADQVETTNDDRGLDVYSLPLSDAPLLSPVTDGGTAVPPASTQTPDQQVLDHLARMVGSVSAAGAASAKLAKNILAVHRTVTQASLAHLTGTPMPVEPNPGNGGPIQTPTLMTQGLIGSMANTNLGMMGALADLTTGRSKQLIEIALKEYEAKGGEGGGDGKQGGGGSPAPNGKGKTGKGLPPDPFPTPGGGGSPAGGGKKPGSQPKPLEPGSPGSGGGGVGHPGSTGQPPDQQPGETVGKPVGGSDDQFETVERPCETYIYTIRGLVYRLGKFHDGTWAMSSGPRSVELVNSLGEHRIIDNFEVYDIDIDKAQWDAYVDQIRREDEAAAAAKKKEADRWVAGEILSCVLSMVPVVGEIKTLLEGVVGVDLVTFEALDDETRAIYLLTALIASPVGTRLFKKLGTVAKDALAALKGAIEEEGSLAKVSTEARNALKEAEQAAGEVRAATEGRGPECITAACEEPATLAGRGSTTTRLKCFPAGTSVRLSDGRAVAIEELRVGDALFSVRDARREVPSALRPSAGEVTSRSMVPAQELIGLECGPAFDTVWTTPTRAFAAPGGYRRAAELRPGDRLLSLAAGEVSVRAISRRRSSEPVHNLEVAEHHTYAVGPLALLVHNGCWEAKSQQLLEEQLRKAGSTLTIDASEPQAVERMLTGRTRQDVTREINEAKKALHTAERAGRPFEEVEALKGRLEQMCQVAGSTYPDLIVTEAGTGRKLAIELKTVYPTTDVFGRMKMYAHELINQRWVRGLHLPPEMENVLVIDVSNAENGKLLKALEADRPAIISAMEDELRAAFKDMGGGYGESWKEVRFMVPGADGPVLTPPITL